MTCIAPSLKNLSKKSGCCARNSVTLLQADRFARLPSASYYNTCCFQLFMVLPKLNVWVQAGYAGYMPSSWIVFCCLFSTLQIPNRSILTLQISKVIQSPFSRPGFKQYWGESVNKQWPTEGMKALGKGQEVLGEAKNCNQVSQAHGLCFNSQTILVSYW